MQQKRLTYFDMAKGFGIILVVLGHIEYVSEPLRAWISSFHMPLFFIISGMLICFKDELSKDMSMLFKKKWQSIIVPYFWFCILYFFVDIYNITFHKINMHTFIEDCLQSLTFYGMSVLWFLPALFLAEVEFIFISKKLPGIKSIIIISVVSIISYIIQIKISGYYDNNINNLVITTLINFIRVFLRGSIAAFFVMVAFYIYKIIEKNKEFNIIELIIGIALFIINIFLSQYNGCVDFHYIILKNVPMYILCAVMGSLGVILIFKNCKNIDSLIFFGKNSLIVMATHVNCYILYMAILISWQIDRIVTRAKSYIFIFNIMIFTFLIEAIVIVIINKYFPFVLGKSLKTKKQEKV